ncbi:hypothetical protein Tco_0568925 [Tanacetum coccineum]
MPTEMELTLEQTQQGVSYEVLVSIEGLKNEKEIYVKGGGAFQNGMSMTVQNVRNSTRWQSYKWRRELCLVDDLKNAHRSQCQIQVQGTSSIQEIVHWKRNCPSYLVEVKKNKDVGSSSKSGLLIELFSFYPNSRMSDTRCGIHICNNLQGLISIQNMEMSAMDIEKGNDNCGVVEDIRSYSLTVHSGKVIVLEKCHYAM